MKVWPLMIQRNSMNPQVHNDPKGISMGSMDFDSPYIYGDTSIFDGLLFSHLVNLSFRFTDKNIKFNLSN